MKCVQGLHFFICGRGSKFFSWSPYFAAKCVPGVLIYQKIGFGGGGGGGGGNQFWRSIFTMTSIQFHLLCIYKHVNLDIGLSSNLEANFRMD